MTSPRIGPEVHEAVHVAVRAWWDNQFLPDVEVGTRGFYSPDATRPLAWDAYKGTECQVIELPPRYSQRGFVRLLLMDGFSVMANHAEFIPQ